MLRNLVTLVVSTTLTLAVVELALRAFGAFPVAYPPTPRWPELYAAHPEYGYALYPSRVTRYRYPERAPRVLTVHSNADGFRQTREIADAGESRRRVFVTGDSFVFGEGVEEEERFTDLFAGSRPDLRVDNLGMTGWGPDLMLLAVEAMSRKARPDVVIVALYYDDFRRVRPRYAGAGYPIPRFRLAGDSLILVPYPEPKPWERLHLYQAGYRALRGGERPLSGPDREEWRINERILDRFRRQTAARGAELGLLYLPGRWSGRPNDRRRGWLRDYADRHGIAFADLTGPIQADSTTAFIPDNGHYAPAGHAIVAEALAALVDRMLPREGRPAR